MSSFPDFLFSLTARDQQVTPLEALLTFDTSGTAAAVTVDSGGYTVPAGKILMLTSAVVLNSPGAAQTCTNTRVIVRPNTSATGFEVPIQSHVFNSVAATGHHFGRMSGPVSIPEGSVVLGRSTFSGGAAANTVQLCLSGVLIPRGNFAV